MTQPTPQKTSDKKPDFHGPSEQITQTHLFFYGHELQLSSSRLQNWYPSCFWAPDPASLSSAHLRFPTAEHYIMYRKAVLMNDLPTASLIVNEAATPQEAQTLGRKVTPYDSALWNEHIDSVAEDACWWKFSQVDECKAALLGTGDKVLAEASPVDAIWGIGRRGDDAARDVEEGTEEERWGRNVLGKALMRVRERLREEEGKGEV